MATTDPRTTLLTGLSTNLGNIKKDDGITNASILHVWESGPETLKYLFFTAGFDAVLTYGEPNSIGVRDAANQSVPVHYNMNYPVTVTTVDKPLTGVLVCTAQEMQYKVTYALRVAAEVFSESVPAASPAYRLTLKSDNTLTKRVGGIRIYETSHVFRYETSYG